MRNNSFSVFNDRLLPAMHSMDRGGYTATKELRRKFMIHVFTDDQLGLIKKRVHRKYNNPTENEGSILIVILQQTNGWSTVKNDVVPKTCFHCNFCK